MNRISMIYDRQLNELWQTTSFDKKGLKSYAPAAALSEIVEQYFVVDNSLQYSIPTYILPDLSAHLLLHEIYTAQGVSYRFSLVGARSSGFLLNRQGRKKTFIIRFCPGILPQLIHISGQESINSALPLGDFFPEHTEQLAVLFFNQGKGKYAPVDVLQWLEQHWLLPLIPKLTLPIVMKGFLYYLNQNRPLLNVRQMAQQIGFSERYLHKVSLRYLGMNPNKAIRIQRLLNSFENHLHDPMYNWSAIAYQSGYADQSHMIAEYQELIRKTPVQLFMPK